MRLRASAPLDDGQLQSTRAAYAFRRAGGFWAFEQKLEPGSSAGAWFGQAVATDGTRLAVGAPIDGAGTTGRVSIHAPQGAPGAGYALEVALDGEGVLATLGAA